MAHDMSKFWEIIVEESEVVHDSYKQPVYVDTVGEQITLVSYDDNDNVTYRSYSPEEVTALIRLLTAKLESVAPLQADLL